MDQRITLKKNEKFDALLQQIKSANESARLLYDDNGMERAEGMIKELNLQAEKPFILLDNNHKIIIENILGVNGMFKDDYTEC